MTKVNRQNKVNGSSLHSHGVIRIDAAMQCYALFCGSVPAVLTMKLNTMF